MSFFKKLAPFAPLALGLLAPGLGTAIGSSLLGAGASTALQGTVGNALIGAGAGALSGGGLKGAAIGGATGGLAGGGGEYLAGQAGVTGTAGKALGGALAGGTAGALSGGGVQSALLGAAIGGAVPYAQDLGDALFPATQFSSEGVPIPTAKPTLSQTTNLTNTTAGGQPMKLGSLLSAGSDIFGYSQGQSDLEDIQKMYQQAQMQAQQQLNPYAQAGRTAVQNLQAPNTEALMNDPGYQFQLQQGNQALERSLAARGLGQSGAALKAAQQYGQGLANQTYNDYFNRQQSIAGQGLQASSGIGSMIGQGANANAAAQAAMINNRNQALSNLFGQDEDGILTGSLGRLIGGLV